MTLEFTKILIKILSQANATVPIQNEILNVLMDIYGDDDDDKRNDLFDSLGLIGIFQKVIPLFKSNINKLKRGSQFSDSELLQWKETALNGRRFIDYKRDQMEL